MEQNLDDYSPASTIINFNHPIPLLRGPIPAGPRDDPSSGPYVLAFKNPQSWDSAYKICNSKIIEQCEGGAQIGCAITASNKCKPPWWRNLAGGGKKLAEELKEREQCEEREMQGCLVAAKEKCVGFANEKCFAPFRDARISVREKEAIRKLLSWASLPESAVWHSCPDAWFGWSISNACVALVLDIYVWISDDSGQAIVRDVLAQVPSYSFRILLGMNHEIS